MPRYNIYCSANEKWGCYSTIVDDMITDWMNKDDYENWRKVEYGIRDYKPAEQCNYAETDSIELKDIQDAVYRRI